MGKGLGGGSENIGVEGTSGHGRGGDDSLVWLEMPETGEKKIEAYDTITYYDPQVILLTRRLCMCLGLTSINLVLKLWAFRSNVIALSNRLRIRPQHHLV